MWLHSSCSVRVTEIAWRRKNLTSTSTTDQKTINDFADYWRDDIGVNVIPANTRKKETYESWKEWQDKPIPTELHDEWKASGAFNNGIAIILGNVWHNLYKADLYLIGIDLDNEKAIVEICNRNDRTVSLSQLSQWTVVEQHLDDPSKAHVLLYSRKLFPKKSSDNNKDLSDKLGRNEIPAIEVKGLGSHGILFVSPSVHQNGTPYQILGTLEPVIADDFVQHIDNICKKYSIPYLDEKGNGNGLVPIQDLFKPDFTIFEGHNRHEAVMRIMESLIARNSCILSLEEIKSLAQQWSLKHCKPQLDDKEFEKQWACATDFIAKKGSQQDEEDTDKGIRSAADLLVELAVENTSLLFKDQYGAAHAQIHIGDHDEILRIESSKFKRHLARLFYEKNRNKVVNSESITNAIQVIQAKAEYEGRTIPLSLRVAWHNGDIYHDMSNEKWQCLKISQQDWEVLSHAPFPLFVRFNQTSQAEPDRNFEPDVFDKFMELTNLKQDQDRILLKVYIVSLFVPDIPHGMLILHGEKGSAKSTLQTLIKLLVDPGKPTLLTVHNDRTEFVQQLAHNHVAYYDNVKVTPGWLSDEACKAVTGIGQTKRKLYSDDDDIVYEYKRCLGFNGINISLTEPDALDRSLMIELDRISKEDRRIESDIISEFTKLKPKLLGYIFDTLVKVLQIKPSVKLNDLPRMADFALWGEAIARAMDYRDLEFIQAYYENIGKQNIEAIENHPLGQAVAKFYEEEINDKSKTSWEGQPAKLLEQLEIVAQRHRVNTNHKSWPKEVRWLTRRLNQIRSNLLEGLGINVTIHRDTVTNTSTIKVCKMTPVIPMTPECRNQAQNQHKQAGDISKFGDNDSGMEQMTPEETDRNHAQNKKTGDNRETGVIFSNEGGRETSKQQENSSSSLFRCYHCDTFQTNDEDQYKSHNAIKHYSRPIFPTKADLEKHKLKPQGKSWEV